MTRRRRRLPGGTGSDRVDSRVRCNVKNNGRHLIFIRETHFDEFAFATAVPEHWSDQARHEHSTDLKAIMQRERHANRHRRLHSATPIADVLFGLYPFVDIVAVMGNVISIKLKQTQADYGSCRQRFMRLISQHQQFHNPSASHPATTNRRHRNALAS